MADYRIFPALIPDEESVSGIELSKRVDAWILQGIAAAHTTDAVNGQSSGMEIAFWLSGNHTAAEIGKMIAVIEDSEPPRNEINLSAEIDSLQD